MRNKVYSAFRVMKRVMDSIDRAVKWSYQIGRVRGIPIEITTPWLVLAGIITFEFTRGLYQEEITSVIEMLPNVDVAFQSLPETTKFLFGMFFVGAIYASILLHEFGHATRAQANGINVKRIRLWVLGGVANIELDSISAKEEFDIAIAGPIVSLALSIIGAITTYACVMIGAPGLLITWAGLVTSVNTIILCFNLIPIFPLDGGRLLRATLQYTTQRTTAAKIMKKVSVGGGIMITGYALFTGDLMYILVAGFVILAADKELSENID